MGEKGRMMLVRGRVEEGEVKMLFTGRVEEEEEKMLFT